MKTNGYARALPPILRAGETAESWPERRAELMTLLREQVYGFSPEETPVVTVESEEEKPCFAGKANLGRVVLRVQFGEKSFSFPVRYEFPKAKRPAPVFVVLNFRPDVPDLYLPAEEILDGGFGFAQICYTDVVNDRYHGDFSDGLGKVYYEGRARRPDEWGKIGMWAYAASRAIDWLYTREEADRAHVMVIGHSRLGKTALYAGMSDERIWATFVNDSGAGGASIARHKETGETIHDIAKNGLWDWFADNYRRWENREAEMPFDMHFAVAMIAPRLVCVGSAEEDAWAEPEGECLSCRAASEVWKLLGRRGLEMPDRAAVSGESFLTGSVGYQMRSGTHFLSRTDWQKYMEFARIHINEET